MKDAIKVMAEYQGRETEENEEDDYDDEYLNIFRIDQVTYSSRKI